MQKPSVNINNNTISKTEENIHIVPGTGRKVRTIPISESYNIPTWKCGMIPLPEMPNYFKNKKENEND